MAQMLIDKQAALDLVRDKCLEILDRCDSHYDVDVEDYVYDEPAMFNTVLTCNKEIRNALSEMPTIDAEPVKRGKWIKDGHHIQCGRCGIWMCDTDREGDAIPKRFCPNCGADMRGEQDG